MWESSELIYLNTFSKDYDFKDNVGNHVQGTTVYITVQDIKTNEVFQLKCDKDYIVPNQLKPGSKIQLRCSVNMSNKTIGYFKIIGIRVLENNGFFNENY